MRYAISGLVLFVICCLAIYPVTGSLTDETSNTSSRTAIQLGNFSVSLTVKDIHASKEFYEKLGFKQSGGDLKRNYVILQNEFQDVREIQQELKKRGLNPVVAADESTGGPAFLTLVDPDGNPILIDQHVPKPIKKQ